MSRKFIIIHAAQVFIFILITGLLIILKLNKWLVINDAPPEDIDVLIKFAGHTKRDEYLHEMAHHYPHASLLVSGSSRDLYLQSLAREKLDTNRLTFIDSCTSTWNEICFFSRWLRKTHMHNTRKVGLISSPFHMRRISFMVQRAFPRAGHQYYYFPVPSQTKDWLSNQHGSWWKRPEVRSLVWLELQKMAYFFIML